MIRRAFLVFAVVGSTLLSGCGVNAVQSALYEISSSLSEVVMAHKERTAAIDSVAAELVLVQAIDAESLLKWEQAKTAAAEMRDAVWVDQTNAAILDFGRQLRALTEAGDKILIIAEAVPRERIAQLGGDHADAVRAGVALARGAETAIETALAKYKVTVQTFNESIRMPPMAWGAKLLGEGPRNDLEPARIAGTVPAPAGILGAVLGRVPPAQ